MNKYKVATMACWLVTALILVGLVIWFITGSVFGVGGNGVMGGRFFNFNFGGFGTFETLTGPFEEVGNERVSPAGINRITIDWMAGEVMVMPHNGTEIIVTEYAQRELRENEQFRVRTSDSTLHIDYVEGRLTGVRVTKRLQVLVPRELSLNMRELSIDSVSGRIVVEDITSEILDVESTSGALNINGAFQRADVSSVSGAIDFVNAAENSRADIGNISGAINISGAFSDVDISSISGAVTVTSRIMPMSVDVSGVSGSVTINLPNTGETISVNHSSVSGRLTSDIPHTTVGGNAQINVSTVSGGTRIQAIGS
jgi:DUF4097 and DUF4098 domain-containing protein YvlB